MKYCKHGSPNEEWCERCRLEPPRGTLRWFVNPDSKVAGVVLGAPNDEGTARVMLLDDEGTVCPMRIPEESIVLEEPWASQPDSERRTLLVRALEVAYASGHLFAPQHELAKRERSSAGPSHCWKCQRLVSYNLGSVGCLECGYYVCVCGHCVCGLDPGRRNYRNDWIPVQPPPPCEPIIRKEYVRIAMKMNDPAFANLGYKPPRGWRRGLDADMMEWSTRWKAERGL